MNHHGRQSLRQSLPRTLLRVLIASGVCAAAATVVVPVVAALGAPGASTPGGTTDGRAPGPAHTVRFDEMYRGGHTHADHVHGPHRHTLAGAGTRRATV